ncbi:MAG TPA: hypothetical protein VG033_01820 [Candidatus Acidoferrales bacterium]|jgi:glutamate synthase domain-containing protein 1/glutamate synthase domain-containing protein 3|nr:hypothetical protein [Candidatus Acidoferrales bacterium]
MDAELIRRILASRAALRPAGDAATPLRETEAEGGCGVIGIACSEKLPARHLLQALQQMRNRGNGKGGGIAAVGLNPAELGVTREVLERDYLLALAYLDPAVRGKVESEHIRPVFEIDHVREAPHVDEFRTIAGLDVRPPDVVQYFVRVKPEVVEAFRREQGFSAVATTAGSLEDEIVYQNSQKLNRAFYSSSGEKHAFVLSHGKNLVVLKMVGYGDDVVRYYKLEDFHANVWIGHHRYPTKGRVWHPGGAHPFVGLHEGLVHNGDFANYASICEYLAQRNIFPLFLTDTEVSVLVFDLLYRTYGYPLEYVIEALAPTTERDFTLLPAEKQEIYHWLQTVHLHGSPDGPWFFLIAQSAQAERAYRLIGITDTSMLRPQVFALQEGEASIGFAASEKQAIDAALQSLAAEDGRFWTHADKYWNARGGSHTDGGAFIFTVREDEKGKGRLECTNKFGAGIRAGEWSAKEGAEKTQALRAGDGAAKWPDAPGPEIFAWFQERIAERQETELEANLDAFVRAAEKDEERERAIEVLTLLFDRRYPCGGNRRSRLRSMVDRSFEKLIASIHARPSEGYAFVGMKSVQIKHGSAEQTVVLDAQGFPPEGKVSLARRIVDLAAAGFRKFIVAHTRGHRFIGNGFGPESQGVRIEVYGSPGDYLGSGMDGAEVFVHGSGQDQLAQIMKDGKLVVFGDVGQTFMYGAKGGQAFILGNAAGRPLINAVGRPRVVINGTCLDYLAESFMAGDPLDGGGFVVLNGITLTDDGEIVALETPYPGGNLFSLSSGGAIYVRDPHAKVEEEQLNGGEFADLSGADWQLIGPYLEENERLFGIPVAKLLEVDGTELAPGRVYRKIRPKKVEALQAEEAWVRGKG